MTNDQAEKHRAEFVEGLRAAAAWLEAHPELPLPSQAYSQIGTQVRISIGIQSWREDRGNVDVPTEFAAAVKALGGSREKDADENYMRVERTFGNGVVVDLWAVRDEVCEAVVVGTEQVEVEKVITPAVTETVTEEREVIEWRCAPVLSIAEAS